MDRIQRLNERMDALEKRISDFESGKVEQDQFGIQPRYEPPVRMPDPHQGVRVAIGIVFATIIVLSVVFHWGWGWTAVLFFFGLVSVLD